MIKPKKIKAIFYNDDSLFYSYSYDRINKFKNDDQNLLKELSWVLKEEHTFIAKDSWVFCEQYFSYLNNEKNHRYETIIDSIRYFPLPWERKDILLTIGTFLEDKYINRYVNALYDTGYEFFPAEIFYPSDLGGLQIMETKDKISLSVYFADHLEDDKLELLYALAHASKIRPKLSKKEIRKFYKKGPNLFDEYIFLLDALYDAAKIPFHKTYSKSEQKVKSCILSHYKIKYSRLFYRTIKKRKQVFIKKLEKAKKLDRKTILLKLCLLTDKSICPPPSLVRESRINFEEFPKFFNIFSDIKSKSEHLSGIIEKYKKIDNKIYNGFPISLLEVKEKNSWESPIQIPNITMIKYFGYRYISVQKEYKKQRNKFLLIPEFGNEEEDKNYLYCTSSVFKDREEPPQFQNNNEAFIFSWLLSYGVKPLFCYKEVTQYLLDKIEEKKTPQKDQPLDGEESLFKEEMEKLVTDYFKRNTPTYRATLEIVEEHTENVDYENVYIRFTRENDEDTSSALDSDEGLNLWDDDP
jgi:hypothetical protein